jgi:threonine dehydrogenase-like Zn-dependent dehydrogenase
MKALVYTAPNTLVYKDTADPAPKNDEVLVQVDACGICGSDMHGYHGHDERRPAPVILGHEASGVVMTGALKGERVTVNPLVVCGSCDACIGGRSHLCPSRMIISTPARPGAFAGLITIPERNLHKVPQGLDQTRAALAEPIAVSYHAVNVGARSLTRPLSAARCVVLGGGAIGLTSALCLALRGAHDVRVAEPHAGRRKTITKAGPFKAYDPDGTDAPKDASADLIIDAVGAAATRAAAFRLIRPGGVIVHLGLLRGAEGVDVRRLTLQEITFTGSFCYTDLDFAETVSALGEGRLGPLNWFEERAMKDGARAFQDIDDGKTDYAKIILHP